MVELVALAARRSDGGCAALDEVARRAAATMAVAGKPTATEGAVGSGANIRTARPSLWQHHLAGDDRRETWTRIDLSISWKTKETQIIGLIPFSFPRPCPSGRRV